MLWKYEIGIAHATGQGDLAVYYSHLIEDFPVTDIVVITLGENRQHPLAWVHSTGCEIPCTTRHILAVIITDIGKEASLAQHELTTPEVGDPIACLVPPGDTALHMHTKFAKRHAGLTIIWLVGVAVKYYLIHTLAELAVAYWFQGIRMLGKSVMMTKGGKGLTGYDLFAIDVGGYSGLLGVVLSAWPLWEAGVFLRPQPELTLGDVHLALHLNLVTLNWDANTRGLG